MPCLLEGRSVLELGVQGEAKEGGGVMTGGHDDGCAEGGCSS